ncbi:Asp23/Gls24 family envelope stress response protein [Planotetraspora mira]|uniref:Asp23/Gls24 family envelope stress response protein n=1 Tax=Planotetraspora mira TaxID=58121 RepID=UPI00194F5A37|nr:Asp23/Gls24 family envelope stress response protein [Planotetraspora mira]
MAESRTSSVQGIPAQRESGAKQSPAPGQGTLTQERRAASGLVTDRGRTTIAAEAVTKIAGVAAREIPGVHDFGTGTARAFGALKGRLGVDDSVTRGIAVEVGERQAAADIALVVDYGVAIPDLAMAVRLNVINAVENMCGLEVTEVNIAVDDVHLPQEDGGGGTQARVE